MTSNSGSNAFNQGVAGNTQPVQQSGQSSGLSTSQNSSGSSNGANGTTPNPFNPAPQSDLAKYYANVGKFYGDMTAMTRARAVEIATKQGVTVNPTSDVSFYAVNGVPVLIKVNNKDVLVNPDTDYSPAEQAALRDKTVPSKIQNYNEESTGTIPKPGNPGVSSGGGSSSSVSDNRVPVTANQNDLKRYNAKINGDSGADSGAVSSTGSKAADLINQEKAGIARAVDLATKNGVTVYSDSKIQISYAGGVPETVTVDGKKVPIKQSDYTQTELNNIKAAQSVRKSLSQ